MQESQQVGEINRRPDASKRWRMIVIGSIIAILIGALAYMTWQWKMCRDTHKKDQAAKQSLQKKIDDLTQVLAKSSAQGSSGSAPSSSAAVGGCSTQMAVPQSLKDTIAAAITSKNTAALAGYMASSVRVVFAASEKGGSETPAAAVTDLDYVNSNAIGPWNFSLPDATINGYKAGFYKQYFMGERYVGKSSNNYVIAFGFDTCAKINEIFVSASADLLL